MVNKWLKRAAVAMTATSAVIAVPTPASASVDGCVPAQGGTGKHFGDICLKIVGGGNNVQYMQAYGTGAINPFHIQLYGPEGVVGNTVTTAPGEWNTLQAEYNRYVAGGNWCARLWSHTESGIEDWGTQCWTVWSPDPERRAV
ncbi:hypothetical protein [Streptomyces sp. NPDC000410]|uniref:hypothetical protein n=1 Tax=Streptomyces sp. NPDC000410 TaxID=3154254 RepID=UPI00331D4746